MFVTNESSELKPKPWTMNERLSRWSAHMKCLRNASVCKCHAQKWIELFPRFFRIFFYLHTDPFTAGIIAAKPLFRCWEDLYQFGSIRQERIRFICATWAFVHLTWRLSLILPLFYSQPLNSCFETCLKSRGGLKMPKKLSANYEHNRSNKKH